MNKGNFVGTVLQTGEERVKLLKAGFSGAEVEKRYVIGNDMKIVKMNLLFTGE